MLSQFEHPDGQASGYHPGRRWLLKGGEAHGAFRFLGRTRADTKRKALDFWVSNQRQLDLTLREFFERCRISQDGKRITFYARLPTPAGD